MTLFHSSCRAFTSIAAALALAGAAHAAPTQATVVIGGKPVPFIVSPYVGRDGQVYGPVDAVHLLGADYAPNPNTQTVAVQVPGAKPFTVPYEQVQGRYCVPLQRVAQNLGASTDWQPTTQTLTIRARLLMVRQDDESLAICTSYPVYYHVQRLDSPNRLFVDLYGLDLASQPATIPVTGGNVLHIRSGQMGYNTVRIVIDLKRNVAFKVQSPGSTDRVQVALGEGSTQPFDAGLPPLPVAKPPVIVQRLPPTLPAVPPGEGVHITGVSYKTEGALTQVLVTTTGEAKFSTEILDNPRRLAFDLAGATLDVAQRQWIANDNPVMKQVRAGYFRTPDSQFGRVVVDLQRPVPFTVTHQTADGGGTIYAINLQGSPPATPGVAVPVVTGSLAGKVVVVDPGHGFQDSGAVGFGVREKDLTLAIGLKVRDVLQHNGATVYMTRDTDSFLPVMARPQVAIAHSADLFVSVHCNSSGPDNSHTGTTVYFHAHNPICRRMAADISARVAELSGIPQDGVKSDTIRFPSGFGVLRGSPMPAVLVECGYVNNSSDVTKLQNPDTQQRIAEGIVAGLSDFLGGRTASR